MQLVTHAIHGSHAIIGVHGMLGDPWGTPAATRIRSSLIFCRRSDVAAPIALTGTTSQPYSRRPREASWQPRPRSVFQAPRGDAQARCPNILHFWHIVGMLYLQYIQYDVRFFYRRLAVLFFEHKLE